MAIDLKGSQLPLAAIPLIGTETAFGLQNAQDVQIPIAAISPLDNIASLTSGVASSGTSDTAILSAQIVLNSVAVGDTFTAECGGLSSSTGTLIFKLHCGAAGTTSDPTIWTSTTSAAQSANAHAYCKIKAVIRTIGSGGTIVAEGWAIASGIGLSTLTGTLVTGAVNTTNAFFLTLSVTCSSGTFTANFGEIRVT